MEVLGNISSVRFHGVMVSRKKTIIYIENAFLELSLWVLIEVTTLKYLLISNSRHSSSCRDYPCVNAFIMDRPWLQLIHDRCFLARSHNSLVARSKRRKALSTILLHAYAFEYEEHRGLVTGR